MRKRIALMASLLLLAGATVAPAAATNAQKCAASKMKASSKYGSCRLSADAKAAKDGVAADYTKCDAKQASSFAKADEKYGVDCPTSADAASVKGEMDEVLGCVATGLGGTPGDCDVAGAALCGNGVIDAGEVCDQGRLGGETCGSQTAGVKNVGTLVCGAGCTSFDTSACVECPATDSALIDGSCWVLGAASASCDGACAAAGMSYSTVTELAGSGGTLADCAAVLDQLGASADVVQNSGPLLGLGCSTFPGGVFYWRNSPATTSTDFYSGFRRACSCQ